MPKELKVVLDTNIIIRAILGRSEPLNKLYDAFLEGAFTPILSSELQSELLNVVGRPRMKRYFRAEELKRFKKLLTIDAILVGPTRKILLSRDPKDNMVLEAALEGGANFVVSADRDLLDLEKVEGIPIVEVHEFLKNLKS